MIFVILLEIIIRSFAMSMFLVLLYITYTHLRHHIHVSSLKCMYAILEMIAEHIFTKTGKAEFSLRFFYLKSDTSVIPCV